MVMPWEEIIRAKDQSHDERKPSTGSMLELVRMALTPRGKLLIFVRTSSLKSQKNHMQKVKKS